MARFLLIEGGFTSGNRGVDALTIGSMHALHAAFPDAEFATIGFTSPVSQIVEQRIMLGDSEVVMPEARTSFRQGIRAALTTAIPHRPSADRALRYFWRADVVIDLSAGDGFGDTYGTKVFLRHAIGKLMALRLGKPLAIFPQTMGPFQTRFARWIARYLLGRADLLCVREPISENLVRALVGPEQEIVCLSDMAFLMEKAQVLPDIPIRWSGSTRPIGVNVSGFLWTRSGAVYGRDNPDFNYRYVVVELVRQIIKRTGRPVLLVPHVFAQNPAVSDLNACREAQAAIALPADQVVVLDQAYPAPVLKAVIEECAFFVGSRMHACISALSTGTPLVPISYSHKFAGILSRFGIEEWIVNPRHHSQDQAIELILTGYEQRQDLGRRITAELPAVQAGAMRAGELLREKIGLGAGIQGQRG